MAERVSLCPPSRTRSLQDLRGNVGQRNGANEDTELGASARHAVDRARGLVLADGETALAINGSHAFGSVGTHSGQNDSHGAVFEYPGHRLHEDVDGRDVYCVIGSGVEADDRI